MKVELCPQYTGTIYICFIDTCNKKKGYGSFNLSICLPLLIWGSMALMSLPQC